MAALSARAFLRTLTAIAVLSGPLVATATPALAVSPTTTSSAVDTAGPAIVVTTPVVVTAPVVDAHTPTRPLVAHSARRHALSFGQRIIAEASRHLGAPYQWGATGPSSFDCSGFTGYVFARQGIALPRVAADQYAVTRHVSSPQIGDLIFNYGSGGIYHVGIYAGNGQMIAATHTGDVVRRESLYGRYHVGRIR